MDATECLVEIEAIQQLKARYQRAVDTKDWDLMRSVLAPDARSVYSDGKHAYEGRDAIVEFLADPRRAVDTAVAQLYADGHAEMRRMWDLQRRLARDLLWHLPDSRVGHNVLEDAFRCLDAPPPPLEEMR